MLKDFAGFDSSDVRAVAHERATKRRIEERTDWPVSGAKAGDLLVVHFSGHGSQVRDRNENELSEGLDEVICQHDMNWDGTFIADDYLQEKLRVPSGVVLEVILDPCHSVQGSVQIGFSGLAPDGSDPDRQPRFLVPPVDILVRYAGESLAGEGLVPGPHPCVARRALVSVHGISDGRGRANQRRVQRGLHLLLL